MSAQKSVGLNSKQHLVTKSNMLIHARQKLSLQERRLIYMFIACIKPDDKDFKMMRLNVREIANYVGIDSKHYYQTVKELVINLQRKGVYIKKDKSSLYVNWLASSEYYEKQGIVEIEFSQKMKPYLLQLKREYTKFKLDTVITLNSIYSMQIYELLKQDLFRKEAIYKLSDLRYMFGLDDKTYVRISQFKSRILDRAQRDLKEHTDIEFTYDDIKQSRQIVAFLFHIKPNKNEKIQGITIDYSEDKEGRYKLLAELLGLGITKKTAEETVDKFSQKRILANIEYVKSKKKKYTNFTGAIISAIREDYALADQGTLFDEEEFDENKAIKLFINEKLKDKKSGSFTDFALHELFTDWMHTHTKFDNDKLNDLWENKFNFKYWIITQKKAVPKSNGHHEIIPYWMKKDSYTDDEREITEEDLKKAKELDDYFKSI